MDFDEVLRRVGERQRYQRAVFLLLAVPCTLVSVGALFNVVFLSATPDHWCRVPELLGSGLSALRMKELSLPREWREGRSGFSRCRMYDLNYTELLAHDSPAAPNRSSPQIECRHGWDYDRTLYLRTLVTQMDVVCDRSWLTSVAMSVFYVGSLIGNPIYGYVGDKFGRKPTLLLVIFMYALVGLVSAFSPSYTFYIVCRFLLGFGFPSQYRISYIMAMELMIPEGRARCGMLYCVFFASGMMLLSGVAFLVKDWFYLALLTSVPYFGLVFLYWWLLTESPRWYLSHNSFEKAEHVVQRMAKFNGKTLPEDFLRNLVNAGEVETRPTEDKPAPRLLDLVRTPNLRKKVVVVNFVWMVIAFDYSGLSLGSTNLGVDDYAAFCISALSELPGTLAAWWAMERLGRRLVICAAMLIGGLSLLSTAIVPPEYVWITFGLSNVGKFGISAAFAVIYVYAAELVPTVLRSLALATCSFTSGVTLILAPQLLYLAEIYGRAFPLTVFGILSTLGGATILLLPETLKAHLPQTVDECEKFGRNSTSFFRCPCWKVRDPERRNQDDSA